MIVRSRVRADVFDLLRSVTDLPDNAVYQSIVPSSARPGMLCTSRIALNSDRGRAAHVLAEEIRSSIKTAALANNMLIEPVHGHLNFYPASPLYYEKILANSESIELAPLHRQRALVESSPPNIGQQLTFIQYRAAVLAESLVNLRRALWCDAEQILFWNDVGTPAGYALATGSQQHPHQPDPGEASVRALELETGRVSVVADWMALREKCLSEIIGAYQSYGLAVPEIVPESRSLPESSRVLASMLSLGTASKDADGSVFSVGLGQGGPTVVLRKQNGATLYGLRDLCELGRRAGLGHDEFLYVVSDNQRAYLSWLFAAGRQVFPDAGGKQWRHVAFARSDSGLSLGEALSEFRGKFKEHNHRAVRSIFKSYVLSHSPGTPIDLSVESLSKVDVSCVSNLLNAYALSTRVRQEPFDDATPLDLSGIGEREATLCLLIDWVEYYVNIACARCDPSVVHRQLLRISHQFAKVYSGLSRSGSIADLRVLRSLAAKLDQVVGQLLPSIGLTEEAIGHFETD